MFHRLKQVHATNGINHHRAWECENCGNVVVSNDDVCDNKKFYVQKHNRGEGSDTVWFENPRKAIESVPCLED